jgi:DNA topoisomerase VI subunit A
MNIYIHIYRYILVVEKDCIFRRLCEDNIATFLKAIIVTGCGKADIYARPLVSTRLQFS